MKTKGAQQGSNIETRTYQLEMISVIHSILKSETIVELIKDITGTEK